MTKYKHHYKSILAAMASITVLSLIRSAALQPFFTFQIISVSVVAVSSLLKYVIIE